MFKIANWNVENVNNAINKIKLSSIDEGVKFALINNLKGWIAANHDSEFKYLCNYICKNYNRISLLKYTGDIIKYFKKFADEDNSHKDEFILFSKKYPNDFVSNENILEYLKKQPYYEKEKNNSSFKELKPGDKCSYMYMKLFFGVKSIRNSSFISPKKDFNFITLVDHCNQRSDANERLNFWNSDNSECKYLLILGDKTWYWAGGENNIGLDQIEQIELLKLNKYDVNIFQKNISPYSTPETGYIYRGNFYYNGIENTMIPYVKRVVLARKNAIDNRAVNSNVCTYYISANLRDLDVISAFKYEKIIEWAQAGIHKDKYRINDIVYIYVFPFYNTLAIKAKVIGINIDYDKTIDVGKYIVNKSYTIDKQIKYMRLELVEFIYGKKITWELLKASVGLINNRVPLTNKKEFINLLESLIEKRHPLDPEKVFGKNYPNVIDIKRRFTFSLSNGNVYFTALGKTSVNEPQANLHICYDDGVMIEADENHQIQEEVITQKLNELNVSFYENDDLISVLEETLEKRSDANRFEINIDDEADIKKIKTRFEVVLNNSHKVDKISLPSKVETTIATYPRNYEEKCAAIAINGNKCEIDTTHKSFTSVYSDNYVEVHHLIPLSHQDDLDDSGNKLFKYSLDNKANMVCLCPNCHRKLHFGVFNEIKDDLIKLYSLKKDQLIKAGLEVSLQYLLKIYKR